jgi:hypothetical protein
VRWQDSALRAIGRTWGHLVGIVSGVRKSKGGGLRTHGGCCFSRQSLACLTVGGRGGIDEEYEGVFGGC